MLYFLLDGEVPVVVHGRRELTVRIPAVNLDGRREYGGRSRRELGGERVRETQIRVAEGSPRRGQSDRVADSSERKICAFDWPRAAVLQISALRSLLFPGRRTDCVSPKTEICMLRAKESTSIHPPETCFRWSICRRHRQTVPSAVQILRMLYVTASTSIYRVSIPDRGALLY